MLEFGMKKEGEHVLCLYRKHSVEKIMMKIDGTKRLLVRPRLSHFGACIGQNILWTMLVNVKVTSYNSERQLY